MQDALPTWAVQPAGDRSAVVVFEHADVAVANRSARVLAKALEGRSMPGLVAIVQGMVSVAVHYAPEEVVASVNGVKGSPAEASPYKVVSRALAQLAGGMGPPASVPGRAVEIPVCYGGAFGPDLEEVARACSLDPAGVIALHTQQPVEVLMLGFAPGHPYIGFFDARLSVGRRSAPRTAVPRGSIGLANRQSVIYPASLPGGWNLIGRTPLGLFDVSSQRPSLLAAGDSLSFVAVTADEFKQIEQIEQCQEGVR